MENAQLSKGTMIGKRVVITGATSGIGKEIALQLAAMGAELVLACRDLDRGKQLLEEITRLTGSNLSEVMEVNTSDQKSIHKFAQEFKRKYSRLDVLINNAGTNQTHKKMSIDGIELVFATNVLGYFILTNDLLDLLKSTPPTRIVNTASTFAGNFNINDLQFNSRAYSGTKSYSQSKACNRMLTWALARRLSGSSVTANAFAPGLVVQTGLYRDVPSSVVRLMGFMGRFIGRTVAEGADTAVWLASSSEVEGINGQFFDQRKVVPCKFRDTQTEEKLWSICEALSTTTKTNSTPG
jgi:NAD(P)-dependent dehydrogenase (short-subunit alcohol dehydrogenase family)